MTPPRLAAGCFGPSVHLHKTTQRSAQVRRGPNGALSYRRHTAPCPKGCASLAASNCRVRWAGSRIGLFLFLPPRSSAGRAEQNKKPTTLSQARVFIAQPTCVLSADVHVEDKTTRLHKVLTACCPRPGLALAWWRLRCYRRSRARSRIGTAQQAPPPSQDQYRISEIYYFLYLSAAVERMLACKLFSLLPAPSPPCPPSPTCSPLPWSRSAWC